MRSLIFRNAHNNIIIILYNVVAKWQFSISVSVFNELFPVRKGKYCPTSKGFWGFNYIACWSEKVGVVLFCIQKKKKWNWTATVIKFLMVGILFCWSFTLQKHKMHDHLLAGASYQLSYSRFTELTVTTFKVEWLGIIIADSQKEHAM